jgi:hypothetical protein
VQRLRCIALTEFLLRTSPVLLRACFTYARGTLDWPACSSQAMVDTSDRIGVLRMDTSVVTALSALAGAAIGGLTSVVATLLIQRAQAREQRLAHYQLRRQDLYREFIEQASKLYIHALQNDKPDISGLMGLYAEVSRMRVLSSKAVVDSADQILKTIINSYLEPNKTFPELRQMAHSGLIDPLRNFSEACRFEAESLDFGPPG